MDEIVEGRPMVDQDSRDRRLRRRPHEPWLLAGVLLAAASAAGVTQPQSDRASGSASIAGRVLAGDTGKALKQARVTLSGGATTSRLTTHTDRSGHYVFSNLARGQYTVGAAKRGYVGATHGQGRLRGIGTPVVVSDGQDQANIDIILPRGGAIGGRVADWDGDDVVDARVHAMRVHWTAGGMRLAQAATATTDDRGHFRLYGLDEGSYCVVASVVPDGGRVESEGTYRDDVDVTSFGPTFYPQATSVADAERVMVGVSEEVLGIDIVLQAAAYGRVAGQVVVPRGGRASGAIVHFFGGDDATWGMPLFSLIARDDGTFSSDRVAAGTYTAFAHVRGPQVAFGRSRVTVSAGQIQSVRLTTSPALSVAGRLATDAGALDPTSMTRVALVPIGPLPPGAGVMARIEADGSFAVNDVAPGRYLVEVTGLPRPYVLKAVFAGSDDVSDTPLDLGRNQPAPFLRVVGTSRGSEVDGRVVEQAGQVVRDATVLAFGEDVTTWRQGGRRAVRALSDTKGGFMIRGLPAGQYYLAAVVDIEDGQWHDPAVLERVRRWATRITVVEGGKVTRDLAPRGLGAR